MYSTDVIRTFLCGLDALTMVNTRHGATTSDLAHETRLPRTTVDRILETLADAGVVPRDDVDEGYRLPASVQAWNAGCADELWLTQSAKSLVINLSREMVGPISVTTVAGSAMMMRETTEHSTLSARQRSPADDSARLLTPVTRRASRPFCAVLQIGNQCFSPRLRQCAARISGSFPNQQAA